jgi:hypothetical protein
VLIWILDIKREDKKAEELMVNKKEMILDVTKTLRDQRSKNQNHITLNMVKDHINAILMIDADNPILREEEDSFIKREDNTITMIEGNIIMTDRDSRDRAKTEEVTTTAKEATIMIEAKRKGKTMNKT